MTKRKSVKSPEIQGRSMYGVVHIIGNSRAMANSIVGLAGTLQKLDASKIDDQDGSLAWYTGAGGFHAGAIQSAIEQLADRIAIDMNSIEESLKLLVAREVSHG